MGLTTNELLLKCNDVEIKKYSVYKISFIVNGNTYFYIGRTKDIKTRLRKHLYLLTNNKHYNNDMQLLFNIVGNTININIEFTTDNFRQCKIVEKELSCNINCINISGLSQFYINLSNCNLQKMREEILSIS